MKYIRAKTHQGKDQEIKSQNFPQHKDKDRKKEKCEGKIICRGSKQVSQVALVVKNLPAGDTRAE